MRIVEQPEVLMSHEVELYREGDQGGSLPVGLVLDTRGWGKGIAWLNGFCLGRYWSRGPQRTLYVPGPVTRERDNELLILELHAATATASFAPRPDLGHTEP